MQLDDFVVPPIVREEAARARRVARTRQSRKRIPDQEGGREEGGREEGGRDADVLTATELEHAVANHVKSFDELITNGFPKIAMGMEPVEIESYDDKDYPIRIGIVSLELKRPCARVPENGSVSRTSGAGVVHPVDSRMGHFTYSAPLVAVFSVKYELIDTEIEAQIGNIPIMVRSKACNLAGMGPEELVKHGEDESEYGGCFLINGIERVIRMLVMPRSNFPMALIRSSYTNRGPLYTPHATLMRCMRPDGTTLTNCLHYSRDGSCHLRFSHSREEWLIPLVTVAFCLAPLTDLSFLELFCGGGGGRGSAYLRERALVMLQQQQQQQPLTSASQALSYLGKKLRIVMGRHVPRHFTNEEVGKYVVKRFFFVHTEDFEEKLATLVVMYQKLMGLVRDNVAPDNQDTFSSHEVLLPGQLYGMVLKENLEVMLDRMKGLIIKWVRPDPETGVAKHARSDVVQPKKMREAIKAMSDIDKKLEYFLATGNVKSRSGLDLMQVSGYTIVADKLNAQRYSSHYVSIHRGQYFAEMKTTTVRKLLPETWGFLCPVHTPDGSPCGLLNHLAAPARTVIEPTDPASASQVQRILATLDVKIRNSFARDGAVPLVDFDSGTRAWVLIDGRPIGHAPLLKLEQIADRLRVLKVEGDQGVPANMEIVCITPDWKQMFVGLFLFLGQSRMVRPVKCLRSGKIEWIGPLEQLYLNIAVLEGERKHANRCLKGLVKDDGTIPEQLPARYTHQETCPTQMFSHLAALTPFSNHNQSPRNMYQCQMLKQTMGTPYHNHAFRSDNKAYMIRNPQKPIVRTKMYDQMNFDTHPSGCNAIVAVITYTGYDMEDAMIINKHSFERGFGNGTVYKVKMIDAADDSVPSQFKKLCRFTNHIPNPDGPGTILGCTDVDDYGDLKITGDGLPRVGITLREGDPICCTVNNAGKAHVHKYKESEPCFVESVTLIDGAGMPGSQNAFPRVAIKLRFPRQPVVGDKFSSRHGQKGVMSMLWPAEDMPFTDSGITPDILFNPHGFPSRMTIGMLIESIAGKAGALEGKSTVNATTFRQYSGQYMEDDNNEDDPFLHQKKKKATDVSGPEVAEYFGSTLVKHGYQRLGTEKMYSGIHGTVLETDIFVGVVYYQRLRHMVADKAQVRMRGPVDRITNQPVKGRSKHGGIRFGEMERDSLLAHGASFLLHDRLMRSSDFDIGFVCPLCGSVLTPQANANMHPIMPRTAGRSEGHRRRPGEPWECPPCSKKAGKPVYCHQVPIPWVFRYLACEMAAMNIKMDIQMRDLARQVSLGGIPRRDRIPALADQAK